MLSVPPVVIVVMKRLVKLLVSLFFWLGDTLINAYRRLAGRPSPARGVVLYYHAVKPEQRAAFARQMDLLLRFAQPWRLDQEFDGKPGSFVAVTFDDGFASVVENALPELKNHTIPFTVFMPTGSWGARPCWIKKPAHPSPDERVMSRDELRSLAAEPLATIGSHSVTHPNFLKLDREAAARELTESKQELESVLGRPVHLFSFPHGACDAHLVQQALDLGYRRVFTIKPRPANPDDPGPVVGRVAVKPDDWPIEFRLKIQGAYRWMAKRNDGLRDHGPHPSRSRTSLPGDSKLH